MPSPLLDATFQAAALSALSNLLAQCLVAYRKRVFSIQIAQLIRFTFFSLLATPPNYAFQKHLESSFPTTQIQDSTPNSTENEEVSQEGRLSVRNTAIKFALDQSLGASINTVFFIAVMGMLKGLATSEILTNIQQDFWPMLSAGYRLWPLVCLLNLVVVPFEHRMLVGNGAAFGWGVYMSLRSF